MMMRFLLFCRMIMLFFVQLFMMMFVDMTFSVLVVTV